MEINRNISMNQVTWFIVMLLGFLLAVFMGSAVGGADFRLVGTVVGIGIGVGTFLTLGKHYWLLIPFSLGASFPAFPIAGRSLELPELAIPGCALFFLFRVAFRKEKLTLFRIVNLPILLFMAWVGIVYILNPIGLAALGSEFGGGRFYVRILLAFLAFIIMSNRQYTEQNIRWILGFVLFGAFFSAAYGIISHFVIGPPVDSTIMPDTDYYSWHQWVAVPAITATYLLFSRWKCSEIFSLQRAGPLLVYVVCILMVLFSGKRMAIVAVLIAPLVIAAFYRQGAAIFLIVGGGILTFAVIVLGQGEFYELPLTVQRTVSFLPGNWDPSLSYIEGGQDSFRDELRLIAMENIKANPWIGDGFKINIGETAWVSNLQNAQSSGLSTAVGMALGRAWHNTWLGYAADFGIPLSILQGVIMIWIIVLSAKVAHRGNNMYVVFSLYVLIKSVMNFVSSHTGGHTANDAYEDWWYYGVMVALFTQIIFPKNGEVGIKRFTNSESPNLLSNLYPQIPIRQFNKSGAFRPPATP